MTDPADLYTFVFTSASAFLVIEAIYGVLYSTKKHPTNDSAKQLVQAKTWIRSILMIVLAIIMLFFVKSSQTVAQAV